MTVAALAPSVEYLENGVTLDFPVPFRFVDPANLAATRLLADGTVKVLAYGVDFTATGGATDAGGTLTLTVSIAGAELFIRRVTARAQQVDYQTLDIFPAETHESALDRAMLIDQEQDVRLIDLEDRAVLVPPGEEGLTLPPVDERAGLYWAWDAEGDLVGASGTGADPNLRADLAQAGGATLVGWKNMTYTGAPSSVDSVLNALLTDVGAATLQQALDAAAGKILYITRDWVLTSSSSAPAGAAAGVVAARTTVIGAGGSITLSSGIANGLRIAGAGVTLRDLTITGPFLSTNPSGSNNGNGVYANGADNLTVDHCQITGWDFSGVLFENCRNVRIVNNLFHSNTGPGTQSDIIGYSAPDTGARIIISGNFCLSNNSQGIALGLLGGDVNATVTANVCAATNGGLTEVGVPPALIRRHGIIVGYNGSDTGGKVTVTGNVCHNTKWTGIYSANGGVNGLTPAVTITGNVCTQNGHTPDASGGLQGGIYVNGGNSTTLIANNSVHDFRGDPTLSIAAAGIVINLVLPTVADATAQHFPRTSVHSNHIDKSAARGISLKGVRCRGVDIVGNTIAASAREDIFVLNPAGETVNVSGHFIERNVCDRSGVNGNDDYPSIYFECQSATLPIHIIGNRLRGNNSTIDSASNANSGILVNTAATAQPFVIENNVIRDYFKAIAFNAYLAAATRHTKYRIRNNHIFDCTTGYIGVSTASTSTTIIELGIMSNVLNFTAAGAQSGVPIARAGRIETYYDNQATPVAQTRFILAGVYAPPTTGTYAQGDRAENPAPAAAGPPAWSCVAGGAPGTWKAWANLAA